MARVLTGVSIGPSPAWLANRLMAVGMRPMNNVVDVSNYVMLELGQPSHTFDLHQVAGGTLRVRWAREGEQLVTLDGQTRTLSARDGVIADGGDVAIGIAGVMGGRSTEISDSTTDVLLEMAWWDPMSIARTSRRLGLRSEASTRFERGADPLVIPRAMDRFAELLARSSPGELLPGQVDVAGNWPGQARVRVRPERVNTLLGVQLAPAEMAELLRPIGFEVNEVNGAPSAEAELAAPVRLDVVVPSFRPDTTIEVDVIEEVARQYGYSRIPATVPTSPADRRADPPPAGSAPAAAHVGRPRSDRGHAAAVPRPGRPSPDGPRRRRRHRHQPARGRGVGAAHLAAAGSAQDVGLQRLPPASRWSPVRARPRLPARRPRRRATG